jgi:hypothetical protein
LFFACTGANLVTIEGWAIFGKQVDSERLKSDICAGAEYRAYPIFKMAKRVIEVAVSR